MQSRLHGLGLDSVRGMRIVLADGSARAVSASEHADLFFALRGAGGGSFGVVTEIDYTVHAASETFHLLSVTVQEASTMATFLYTLGERQSSLPGNVVAMHDMPLTVNLFWSGRDEADVAGGDAYLRQLVGELLPPDAPVETEAGTYSWPGAFGQRPASSDDDDDDVPWSHDVWAAACWCGFLLPENNTAAVWQRMMELISTAVQDCPDLLPDIELWGGAIGDTAANQTAFPHRSAIYNVGVLLTIPVDRPDPDAYYKQQNAKVNTWWPNVSQYLTGSYVNYPQVSLGRDEYAKTYWGDNLPRLRQIKQRYDPDNVFHHPLSVPIE
jgi:FAD/FMN-containing dehydrogenase